MARNPSRHPTDAELEILKVVWARGPSTVRQVLEVLTSGKGRARAYTSVMTVMTIMNRKGYLRRRKAAGAGFVYAAKVSEQDTGRGMMRDLIERVFGGSASAAALHLVRDHELDDEELRQLRELVDRKTNREKP